MIMILISLPLLQFRSKWKDGVYIIDGVRFESSGTLLPASLFQNWRRSDAEAERQRQGCTPLVLLGSYVLLSKLVAPCFD